MSEISTDATPTPTGLGHTCVSLARKKGTSARASHGFPSCPSCPPWHSSQRLLRIRADHLHCTPSRLLPRATRTDTVSPPPYPPCLGSGTGTGTSSRSMNINSCSQLCTGRPLPGGLFCESTCCAPPTQVPTPLPGRCP